MPNTGPTGLRWDFYNYKDRIHLLEFTSEVEDEKESKYVRSSLADVRDEETRKQLQEVQIRGPSEGATDHELTKTLPETFISMLSKMALRKKEREQFLDIQWWYRFMDENC